MSADDPFGRVLEALHAAAFDDDAWPAASGLVDALCGSTGNILVTGDGAPADGVDVFHASFCHRGLLRPDWQREYFAVFHAIDERIPRLRRLPDSRVVHASALYTDAERRTSPAWNEALVRSGTRDSLNMRLDGPGGSRIAWVVADPAGGGWSGARVEAVERLLPHLRQYVRVRQALADAGALGASALDLLENGHAGVIRLDRRGRVAAASDRALAILNEPGGLYDRGGFLHATLPLEDRKLQGLLAAALPFPGGPGAAGSMPVTRPAPQPRLALQVSPVSGNGSGNVSGDGAGHGDGAGSGADPPRSRAGALVLLSDPAARPGLDPGRVAAALGLTPAESRIAVLIARARSIDDIAAATGRSRTTVKWHIRNIYEKHGLRRQVELAQLVLSLAGLPGMRG